MADGCIRATEHWGHRSARRGRLRPVSGRNDDLIRSGGYRIGPAEVEESLLQLSEVAVVGVPDAACGEIVKAFVTLAAGVAPSEALVRRMQQHVRESLAAHKYPHVVEFVDALSATTTGKLDRRRLREREQAG